MHNYKPVTLNQVIILPLPYSKYMQLTVITQYLNV